MSLKPAIGWTIFWIIAAVVFNAILYNKYGAEIASQFTSVYVIEKLLSFDNLFVFLLIFNHFKVPHDKQRKVLNYGLVGAFIFRAIFIGLGITIVEEFKWLLYIFGGILIYSAYGVAFGSDDENDISESKTIKFCNSLSIKPIIAWIIAIELSDIVFAVDSIPASLSISQDMLIIYSANIFAILGLRSLYFVIQSLYDILPQLKYGIALILTFVGAKMFLPIEIPPAYSLAIIMMVLTINCLVIVIKKN